MITDYILGGIYIVIGFVLLPLDGFSDVTLSPNIATAIQNADQSMTLLQSVFPLGTLFAAIAVVLAVELAIFAFKFIVFGIKKIPFIN